MKQQQQQQSASSSYNHAFLSTRNSYTHSGALYCGSIYHFVKTIPVDAFAAANKQKHVHSHGQNIYTYTHNTAKGVSKVNYARLAVYV